MTVLLSRRAAREKQAAYFRKSAEVLTKQIEAKRHPAISQQNITARRARIASSMADDADYIEKTQQVLLGMAIALEKNQLPRLLRGITTKGMVEFLIHNSYRPPGLHKSTVRDVLTVSRNLKEARKERASIASLARKNKDCDYFIKFSSVQLLDNMLTLIRLVEGKPSVYLNGVSSKLNIHKRLMLAGIKTATQWQNAHELVIAYATGLSPEQKKEKELKSLEYDLIGTKIPGFFPTPKAIVERLVDLAEIKKGMTVLEPSAGKGDIAEVIREKYPKIALKVIEINMTLTRVLSAKGFKVQEGDFLNDTGFYDRIIMNPPFENGQDIAHVRWAYSRLKPGGRVVSIVGEGLFFREEKRSTEFREWLEKQDAQVEKLNHGAFQGAEAFRQTGVASRIIILDKRR